MKKALKVTTNIIISALLIVTVALFILKMTGTNLSTSLPINLYRISSPSMVGEKKDSLDVGDIVICIKTKPNKLEVGDIVTYVGADVTNDGVADNITHRIIEIYEDNETGKTMFVVQGDANNSADAPFSEDALVGKVTKLVVLTFLYNILIKPWGFIVFIVCPLVFLIIKEVITLAIATEKDLPVKEETNSIEIPVVKEESAGEKDEKE